jgi:hypothetical protein
MMIKNCVENEVSAELHEWLEIELDFLTLVITGDKSCFF